MMAATKKVNIIESPIDEIKIPRNDIMRGGTMINQSFNNPSRAQEQCLHINPYLW